MLMKRPPTNQFMKSQKSKVELFFCYTFKLPLDQTGHCQLNQNLMYRLAKTIQSGDKVESTQKTIQTGDKMVCNHGKHYAKGDCQRCYDA